MVIVVIGPSSCGKTTVGKRMAEKLGWPFEDADDFHLPENVAKMSSGTPLDDEDRAGWLETLSKRIKKRLMRNENLVLACSALKQSYRDTLGIDQKDVVSVYLKGSKDLLQERTDGRHGHYMNKGLLTSQIATMEEPQGGLIIDISRSPAQLVDEIIGQLQLAEDR